jgi:uncharacterized protein YndB with AHSA1/START domain
VVSASREIAAGPGRIFELIADPAQQPRWDGDDNLAAAPGGQRVRRAGEVFTMTLTYDGAIRENHVVEFEEGRRIAWRPAASADETLIERWIEVGPKRAVTAEPMGLTATSGPAIRATRSHGAGAGPRLCWPAGEPGMRRNGNQNLNSWQCRSIDGGPSGSGHCAGRGGVRDGHVACWPWFGGAARAGDGHRSDDQGRAGHRGAAQATESRTRFRSCIARGGSLNPKERA